MKKKMVILVSILMLLMATVVNAKGKKSKEEKKFEKAMQGFQLEAVIKTTKGEISFYLYPEAAPKNVASFVFLAKNDFYNGLTFFRVVPNALVQGGDPSGNGTGTAGYFLSDEFTKWLTIIGGTKNCEDLSILRTLRQDDKILNIDIKGKKVDKFLDYFPEEVIEWESKLQKPENK